MYETSIVTDTLDPLATSKSVRSRFSFLRPKGKNSQHLEKAARKLAESSQVNNNQCQSRYIILPSNKHHDEESHHQSPSTSTTSSSPLIDLLTNDDVFSDSCEETHILIPSPLFSLVKDERITRSSSPPPRPRTRHPRLRARHSINLHTPDVVDKNITFQTCSPSNTQSPSSSSSSCSSASEKTDLSSTDNTNNNNNNNVSLSSLDPLSNSCVNKSPKDRVLPEQLVQSITSITYSVKYVGCQQILTSMRSLDFETRTDIVKECIRQISGRSHKSDRICNQRVAKMIADQPDFQFTGCEANLHIINNIDAGSLELSVIQTGQVIAKHDMPNISFASNGDGDLSEYVAYVAKDHAHKRSCFVLQCEGGLAHNVINSIGQAFELRFKEFMKRSPRPAATAAAKTTGRPEPERDYYNDLPGKVPPDITGTVKISCNLIPSICARSRLPQATPRNVKKSEDREDQSFLIDLEAGESSAVQREYVNYQSSSSPIHTVQDPPKDPFDMTPFNSTLQELSRKRLIGDESSSLSSHTWFHGTISRKESESLVEKDGDFLVRESIGSPGQFVLTGKQDGQCQHLLLVDPSGEVRTKDLSFDSVLHLIQFHRDNNLPIVSAESILNLRNSVPCSGPIV